jgi:hypothetical protein
MSSGRLEERSGKLPERVIGAEFLEIFGATGADMLMLTPAWFEESVASDAWSSRSSAISSFALAFWRLSAPVDSGRDRKA